MNSTFPQGNFDSWKYKIEVYLPKAIEKITKGLDPVLQAALLALTGSSEAFSKHAASIKQDENYLEVTLSYKVPSFIQKKVAEDDVTHDREFINAYLLQIGITAQIKIDTDSGIVIVVADIPLGWNSL